MNTSIYINTEDETIHAEISSADASSGIVLPGIPTGEEIIAYCNANLNAPYEDEKGTCHGDYTGWHVDFSIRYNDGKAVSEIRKKYFNGRQVKMGKALGVSHRTIEGWEQGRQVPKTAVRLIYWLMKDQLTSDPLPSRKVPS